MLSHYCCKTRTSVPSQTFIICSCWKILQATEYDRTIAIWNRKDSCFCSDNAFSGGHGSETTSGKALEFCPVLYKLQTDTPTPQAICIAPSRELAIQIMSVVQKMGEYTPVECFFGGRDSVKRGMPKLTQQVVIGTPGTIIDVRCVCAPRNSCNRLLQYCLDGHKI